MDANKNQENTEVLKAVASRVTKAEYLLSHGMVDDAKKVLHKLSNVLPKPGKHNVNCAVEVVDCSELL
ncbi:hypothetical protein ABXJ76_03840 [Methylobacter sp. G7]|uniref:hypothetical protein n=1 Tax=Methylobacter sp. G7 TaxID=3230117 RepID=UPI003D804E4F